MKMLFLWYWFAQTWMTLPGTVVALSKLLKCSDAFLIVHYSISLIQILAKQHFWRCPLAPAQFLFKWISKPLFTLLEQCVSSWTKALLNQGSTSTCCFTNTDPNSTTRYAKVCVSGLSWPVCYSTSEKLAHFDPVDFSEKEYLLWCRFNCFPHLGWIFICPHLWVFV